MHWIFVGFFVNLLDFLNFSWIFLGFSGIYELYWIFRIFQTFSNCSRIFLIFLGFFGFYEFILDFSWIFWIFWILLLSLRHSFSHLPPSLLSMIMCWNQPTVFATLRIIDYLFEPQLYFLKTFTFRWLFNNHCKMTAPAICVRFVWEAALTFKTCSSATKHDLYYFSTGDFMAIKSQPIDSEDLLLFYCFQMNTIND